MITIQSKVATSNFRDNYLLKNCVVDHNVQYLAFFRKHNNQSLLLVVNMAGIRFDSAQMEMD